MGLLRASVRRTLGAGGQEVIGAKHASPDAPRGFLEALHHGLPGFTEIRPIDRDGTPFLAGRRFAKTPNDAGRAVAALSARGPSLNTYVGVATRLTSANGRKNNLASVRAVFADLDFTSSPECGVRERLAAFSLPPSIVVRSGGGLHVYWLLTNPVDLQDAGELRRFESTLRSLAIELGADPACAEAARVLRPPGTWNYPNAKKVAFSRTPTPVELEFLEPARMYAIEDFPQLDPALDPPEIQLSDIPDALPESIKTLIEDDSDFRDRWLGNGDGLADTSRSGIDLSVAATLAHRGHTPEEVAAALLHRPGGKAPKAGSSYLEHTVARAFKGVDHQEISTVTLLDSGPQQEDPEAESEATSEESQSIMQLPDAAKRGSFAVFIDHMKPVTGANPIHLFGAWLTVLGACIGHSRWGKWSGRVVAIFYSLLFGPTGDHKSTAMDGALEYLPERVVRISGVTTDAGLFERLEDAAGRPVLLHFDELGYLLQASRYQGSQLNSMLNDLYSAPACLHRNLRRRNKSAPAIRAAYKPFVCIVGGTHPDTFWRLIGDDALAISSGFVNRLAPFLVEKGRSLPVTEEPDAKAAQHLREHLVSLSVRDQRTHVSIPEPAGTLPSHPARGGSVWGGRVRAVAGLRAHSASGWLRSEPVSGRASL